MTEKSEPSLNRHKASRLLLLILALAVVYFFWEFIYLMVLDSYCIAQADKLPNNEKVLQVKSPINQKDAEWEYVSKYTQVKWQCQLDSRKIPTPFFGFLNEHFP